MDSTIVKLISSLKATLKARDFDMTNLSDAYLEVEIRQAIKAINSCRNFTATESKLYDTKYEYLIIPMCLSSIAKIGAEGETAHNENNISRSYGTDGLYPKDLLRQIIPLAK